MSGRRISAFALLLACASAPLHANASSYNADCWQGSEVEALKLQRFKTMLLVSMLNCRDLEPGMNVDYNRFMRANRALIAEKQAVVRQHFIRTHGPAAGLNAYSVYETALGNQFSGANFTPSRCASAAAEMREAGYVSERGLMDMVQSVPDEDVAICGPEPRYVESTDWSAPRPQPAPQAEETGGSQDWPDLAAVEPEGPARAVDPNIARSDAGPPPPVAMPDNASASSAPVLVAAADTAKPAPDRVKAVKDAAKALREALEALEADENK